MDSVVGSWDLSSGDRFRIWLYVHDIDSLQALPLYIYISSVANFAKSFRLLVPKVDLCQGWNHITACKSDFVNMGVEDWANEMIRFRMYVTAKVTEPCSLSFDDFRFDVTSKPKVLMTFDDNSATQFTRAYPVMSGNGQRGVIFCVTERVDVVGFMTLANLLTLRDAGWDICNHTVTHCNLVEADEATMKQEIDDAYDWLVANGFEDSAKFLAYPDCAFNETVIDYVRLRHVMARICTHFPLEQTHFLANVGDSIPFQMCCESVTFETSVNQVKAWIDKVIEGGGQLSLLWHYIVIADPGPGEWTLADFTEISNYLKTKSDAGQLDVVTMKDYHNALDGY